MKKMHKIKLTSPIHLFAIGFGCGLSPYFPGTVGSAVAIILWLPISQLIPLYYWSLIIIMIGFGIWICQKTADTLGASDPSSIVWDEFVGMWITLFFIPQSTWQWMLVAFLLFRFFDILKPWPIYQFDRHVSGGVGIMIDDIIAGFFSGIMIFMLTQFF